LNFTVTPGFAFSNWAPILSKASVSDVAANTTTVPEIFPDAEELPDEEEPLDDELHAASSSAATAAQKTVKSAGCRLRGARGEGRPARALVRVTSGRLPAPIAVLLHQGSHIMPTHDRSRPSDLDHPGRVTKPLAGHRPRVRRW
jgi:hypothetical protein